MPIHDWTRVDAGIYHGFHLSWIAELRRVLNTGVLPPEFYAEIERPAGGLLNHVAIRNLPAHRLASVIEVVSPLNKDSRDGVARFVSNVRMLVESGTHVTTIDLFPATRFVPGGLHGEIWRALTERSLVLPPNKPCTLASYVVKSEPEVYLEPLAVSEELPPFPLFLTDALSVNLPLADTYAAAFAGSPPYLRELLSQPAA